MFDLYQKLEFAVFIWIKNTPSITNLTYLGLIMMKYNTSSIWNANQTYGPLGRVVIHSHSPFMSKGDRSERSRGMMKMNHSLHRHNTKSNQPDVSPQTHGPQTLPFFFQIAFPFLLLWRIIRNRAVGMYNSIFFFTVDTDCKLLNDLLMVTIHLKRQQWTDVQKERLMKTCYQSSSFTYIEKKTECDFEALS